VPVEVAEVVTNALTIPTIGIGAGVNCDGQVLVWHDLLGLDEDFCPPFAKSYRQLGRVIVEGLQEYRAEVKERSFPAPAQTRNMAPTELLDFESRVKAC
jgi:3-methyl-2-oxobutanoate hydroxymethyltransferase